MVTAAEPVPVLMTGSTVHNRVERRTHTVDVELRDVTGAPTVRGKDKWPCKHPIEPSIVLLAYEFWFTDGRWRVSARVYGRMVGAGTRMNGWADFHRHPSDTQWPDWLAELADVHHPERPGGWPGDDPTGSYL